VTNAAYAKGSFNNNPISSPLTVALVRYKQPIQKEEHNDRPDNGGYGGAVIPMIPAPVPMMSGSPMYGNIPDGYGNVPNGYGSEPNVYTSGPSTTEIQNSKSNVHKTKVHLSKHKHKHKNHSKHHTKHHKTGKNT
jgi:hypothetical protein